MTILFSFEYFKWWCAQLDSCIEFCAVQVLGSAWKSVSFLQSALQQVAESNISVVDALPAGLHEQWVRRWNLLAYKWERW